MLRSCRWCEHVSMHGVTPEAFIQGVNRAFCVYGSKPKELMERGSEGTLMKNVDYCCIMFKGSKEYEEQSRILERSF